MLNYAKAIGANTDFLTAQAFIFPESEEGNKLLILVISGCAEDGFTKIRKVGLESHDLFFESDLAVGERFEQLSNYIKQNLLNFEKIEAVLGFFEGNSLYLQTLNHFNVFLKRQNSTLNLTQNLESGKLISGLVEPDDKILFINAPLTETEDISLRTQLRDNIFKISPENLEFELEAFLQQYPKSDPVATILIENYIEKNSLEEPEVQFSPALSQGYSSPKTKLKLPSIHSPDFRRYFRRLGFKKGGILLLAVIIGFFFLFNSFQKQAAKDNQFKSDLSLSGQKLDQAQSLKDSDISGAKQALAEAKIKLNDALSLKPKDKDVLNLQQKYQEQSYQILKQYQVSNFPLFLDLNLIKEGFSVNKMSYSLGKIALLDTTNKTLVSLDIAQKLPKVLAGSFQLGELQNSSVNGDNVFVFSKDKGLLQVDIGNGKVTTIAASDADWQRIVEVVGFANNVYLLDEFKNQIWKYIATDTGFTPKTNYLRVDVHPDFAGARRMQIDGAVWILKSDNKILKFIQGGEDFYSLQNFDKDLSSIKSFFTSDETENVYLLDNDNSRVVLTKKNGEYVGEYDGDKFKTADDLVVDEKNKKMYLLEGNKIYLVDLK